VLRPTSTGQLVSTWLLGCTDQGSEGYANLDRSLTGAETHAPKRRTGPASLAYQLNHLLILLIDEFKKDPMLHMGPSPFSYVASKGSDLLNGAIALEH